MVESRGVTSSTETSLLRLVGCLRRPTLPPSPPSRFADANCFLLVQNLDYEVRSHHDRRTNLKLLQDVSAYLEPGQMTALMGPSGSGKTTLLDLLAGRKTQGKMTGELLYGGAKPSKRFLRRYTGYVEQFDTLIPILTVEEMLMYTAELKLPSSTTVEEKKRRVDHLIRKLGLEVCRHTQIGSALVRGISGGQSKRVNIGIALITEVRARAIRLQTPLSFARNHRLRPRSSQPRILFLDEPTSGLDSFTSNEVMSVVKGVAASGCVAWLGMVCPRSRAP